MKKYFFSLLAAAFCFTSLAVFAEKANSYPIIKNYSHEVNKFKTDDLKNFPPKNAILFIGSSTFTKWNKELPKDMDPLSVIPRGFGGSTMNEVLYYAKDIVFPYHPRAIVLYEGDNDVAIGISPKKIADTFQTFFDEVEKKLPNTRIYVVSIKPCQSRWKVWPEMQETNELLKQICSKNPNLTYIDTTSGMLNPNGSVKKNIFLKDNLHMNRKGYIIWGNIIKPVLMKNELKFETKNK